MQSETSTFDNATAKAIAVAVIIACVALGAIGLVMPFIPGLLFLTVAAVIAAKLSPSFESTLRQNATIAGYLDRTDGFLEVPLGKKIQVMCLLWAKMLMDGVALLVSGVTRLLRAVERT